MNKLLVLIISLVSAVTTCKTNTQSGLSSVQKSYADSKSSNPELDTIIWSIYQDRAMNYWFGSKENGVYKYNGKVLTPFTVEDGLISNEIRGIQEDAAGNLFFETTEGVSKYDGQQFQTLEVKENDLTKDNWHLNPTDLWFRMGFNNNGPYRYDGEYLHYLELPPTPQEEIFRMKWPNIGHSPYGLYYIYKDREGHMWFGTAELGVCRYDGHNFSWYYEDQLQTTPNGGSFGTRSILQDREDYYWINNSRYKYKFEPNDSDQLIDKKEKGIGYSTEEGIEYPFYLSIIEDDDGDLWMATYGDGVWRYDGAEFIHYPITDQGKKVLLFTIYKDQQGTLWLGTHNAGVLKYNGKNFEKFSLPLR